MHFTRHLQTGNSVNIVSCPPLIPSNLWLATVGPIVMCVQPLTVLDDRDATRPVEDGKPVHAGKDLGKRPEELQPGRRPCPGRPGAALTSSSVTRPSRSRWNITQLPLGPTDCRRRRRSTLPGPALDDEQGVLALLTSERSPGPVMRAEEHPVVRDHELCVTPAPHARRQPTSVDPEPPADSERRLEGLGDRDVGVGPTDQESCVRAAPSRPCQVLEEPVHPEIVITGRIDVDDEKAAEASAVRATRSDPRKRLRSRCPVQYDEDVLDTGTLHVSTSSLTCAVARARTTSSYFSARARRTRRAWATACRARTALRRAWSSSVSSSCAMADFVMAVDSVTQDSSTDRLRASLFRSRTSSLQARHHARVLVGERSAGAHGGRRR